MVQDVQTFGKAPIRAQPTGLDKPRFEDHENHSPASAGGHRFHFPGHRHTRSKEDQKASPRDPPWSGRPQTSKEESFRRNTEYMPSPNGPLTSRSQLSARATSPLPSGNSISHERSPAEPTSSKTPRSFLNKIRGIKGGDKSSGESLKNLPGSQRSLQDPYERTFVKIGQAPGRKRDFSTATTDSDKTIKPVVTNHNDGSRKDSKAGFRHGHGHGHGKYTPNRRNFPHDAKDSPKTRGLDSNELYLDTDLRNMEGIVSAPPPETPQTGVTQPKPADVDHLDQRPYDNAPVTGGGGDWYAPDSWGVRPELSQEEEQNGTTEEVEDTGVAHGLRVFRIDSTFATLSTNVNTTAGDILGILGKKSFLQDDIKTYQIIMRKNDLQRQLERNERPVVIQKRLLELAGYTPSDHIEEVGREDNSYLCRFTFVPTKITGYYNLESDPDLEKQPKFSHIDLTGRSLVTIPIILYKKAAEIISLNLSRNLALDVPKDFIQGCTHLREIKYVGNEAVQLPPSFSLASRMTVLDVSNNFLESLDKADLGKLQNLASIKLPNNRLKALPDYFSQFRTLRSLNLSSNYLLEFPTVLCTLNTLVDLDISFNSIQKLPKIGQLTALERLAATNNKLLGAFPDDLKNLQNLREVDIRFNGITSIDVFSKLPKLEQLFIGHNAISSFEGAFERLTVLHADHNPITRFDFKSPVPTLTSLNLASAKITHLDDSFYERVPNLKKMKLDKNHFASLSNQVGRMTRLEYLSIAKNPLNALPTTIGCLTELKFLDAHECNLRKLPSEIWCCLKLDTLNLSSNVMDCFPTLSSNLQQPNLESASVNSLQSTVPPSPANEDGGRLEDVASARRPSQASTGLLSVGSSPLGSTRKGSIVSVYGLGGRKASVISRTPTGEGMSPLARKDSNIASRLTTTFAGSLRHLLMADNRIGDDIFDMISLLPELRVLNLSYNEIDDIPANALRRWPNLHSLFLSGNELSSLPSDDLAIMDNHPLKTLYLNCNKFQVLPAELGKVKKLVALDIGSNSLKYNVSNWRFDWNWSFNTELRYLNLSGNKRLEIKPQTNQFNSNPQPIEPENLTNFSSLRDLRVLGLMDVTLTINSIPDQTDDRRIRTSGTAVGTMTYGMADSLGRNEHLSIIDMLIPKFRGHDTETLLGLFDGQSLSSGGSKVAKYLHENFSFYFTEELSRINTSETAGDALRRAFLSLNKELATTASQTWDEKERKLPQLKHRGSTTSQMLSEDDLHSGGVATVLFLDNMELFVANVGDAQALLIQSDGGFKMLTQKHDPASPNERLRIREAGGYVSRHGKLNDALEVSRAFGYIQHMPAIMAAPFVERVTLKETDEMVLVASREMWEYIPPDMAVDIARSERGDIMRAAQKLRDLAIAFGATNKIMVMLIGISDLKKRERSRNRGSTMPSQWSEDGLYPPLKRPNRKRENPEDYRLAILDREIDAPTGELSLIFTDIKSSTAMWELFPIPMRTAIKIHNDLLRRQLRIIGGYEVKTEGDAFMVAFPTATSALLWCFSVQSALLTAEWPVEILDCVHGQEVQDSEGTVIYRGLSVRMGMHWGSPVCEPDPITKRMDYFGPMVNRASRISSVADGGQITVSADLISEIERIMETYSESDRSGSTGSEDTMMDDVLATNIRRELRALSSQGFGVKDLGERKLKGLENPEYIYLMYPHQLAGRLTAQSLRADQDAANAALAPATLSKETQLSIDPSVVWELWNLSLRLEMLCSSLETPGKTQVNKPETAIMERMKNRGGEVSDRFLVQFVDHLVTQVEVSNTQTVFE